MSVSRNVLLLSCICLFIGVREASRVRFITYLAGFASADLCSSVHSVISNGIDLNIVESQNSSIGQLPTHLATTNFSAEVRPIIFLRYLQDRRADFSDDDIIVFSDVESALYATNASHLETDFRKIERNNTILFAADRVCRSGVGGCPEVPSAVKSSYRFPNSGGWIARYSVAMKFLPVWGYDLMKLPQGSRHDQKVLHQLMMQNGQHNESVAVRVDYNCVIFQTIEPTREKWAVVNDKNPYMRPDGVLYNPQTNSEPHIYIFSGDKSFMSEAQKVLWVVRTASRSTSINCKAVCLSLFRNYPILKSCRRDPAFLKLVKSNCHSTPARRNASFYTFTSLYPTTVQYYPIRTDPTNADPVQRGRLNLLKVGTKYTMKEYQRILQCSPIQPEIYGPGGAMHLMSFILLTSETIMLTAAFIESTCGLWDDCRLKVEDYLAGKYPPHADNRLAGFHSMRLFRVINGALYLDWPWGKERLQQDEFNDYHYRLLFLQVLRFVSDAPDSVFFAGSELYGLPPNLPVPHFSSSPATSSSSDIPAPWNRPFHYEKVRYDAGNYDTVNTVPEDIGPKGSLTGVYNKTIDDAYRAHFSKRLDKAAFFGALQNSASLASHRVARQVIFSIAYDHPEHLVAGWSHCQALTDINPASTLNRRDMYACGINQTVWESTYSDGKKDAKPFGFHDRTMRMKTSKEMGMTEYMLSYKYLIVIAGVSSADRLNTFLAHSGAVILLQETDFRYHYSAFLKPWVHYVPLAYNGADVLEKILWLKKHPKMAQRLALNARNFGQSYLRLEDYYCYASSGLEAMGTVTTPSSLTPFNVTLVKDKLNPNIISDFDLD